MSEIPNDQTALAIIQTVEKKLRSLDGASIVGRLNKLIAELADASEILVLRASLRRRDLMQFYTSASRVRSSGRREALSLSARVNGVECGTVAIRRTGPVVVERLFTPTDTALFSGCQYGPPAVRPWEDPEVAGYIARAAKVKVSRPEASVESSFLSMLLRRGGRLLERPVCLAGCPLQIPLPISASGEKAVLSPKGHLDVLSRLGRGGKGLRLYELKAPGASVAHALDQAVAYAAALRVLLSQEGHSLPWWRLIGFRAKPRHALKLEVVTLVQDSPRNRKTLDAAKQRLSRELPRDIKLGTCYYPEPPAPFRVLDWD
jgi:hypothetical protein